MLREEETKWYQRVKVKELLEGGSNTKYFQFITSGKHRKTQIFWLQHNDMIIEGDHELKIYVTSYYKDIFGQPAPSSFSLDESRVNDIVQVSAQENDILISPFMMDDVWEAIFQMEYNKAPCPDGFRWNFTSLTGRLLRMISWFYSENSIEVTYPCIVSTLGR
jgi:hypothetical protein